jgi:surfeit locus 1 family protein
MLARYRSAGLVGPFLMTLVGLAILLSLGAWQLQRKAWKEDLVTKLDARAAAPAVSLNEAVQRFRAGEDIEYLRVTVGGRYRHDLERYYYAPDPEQGSGVNVYTPMETAGDGAVVFVNRGFVPDALKDRSKRADGLVAGAVEVTGLVRNVGARQRFVPENDVKANLWYWRDLSAMLASAFGNAERPHIPFFVDAEASSSPPGYLPKGGATLAKLTNRHLEYAITWFGLAATLASIFVIFARARMRGKQD